MAIDSIPAKDITRAEILCIIEEVERKHRVVWTAGRILIEDGSEKRIATQKAEVRKPYYNRIRKLLKEMAADGILRERGIQFNYGAGKEASYDYMGKSGR